MTDRETMTDPVEAFTNRQVDLADLPDYQLVDLQPVSERYFKWALLTQTSFWVVVAGALWVLPHLPFATIDWKWWIALPLGSMALALVTTVYFALDARVRAWALREHDLVYRYGLFWRKTVILPFARIQHVEALQGPVERYLDLMRLKCFTAGGLSADLLVRGLDSGSARKVRGFLLEQIAEAAEVPDGSETDEPHGER
jgi:membrane protein YdbS with pleckstrin-like domain